MTVEEVKEVINELKAKGMTDEEIAKSFYYMYKSNKIDLDQFEALVKLVGFEAQEGFLEKERSKNNN